MEWKTDKHVRFFALDGESESVDTDMLHYMHPAIVYMIAFTNLFGFRHGIDIVWTSWIRTEEQDKALNAKSSSHRYRAADLSLKESQGWTDQLVVKYQEEIKAKFMKYGALVPNGSGGYMHRPILIHNNGNGNHAHLQVKP